VKLAAVAVLLAAVVAWIPSAAQTGCCPSPVGSDYSPAWSPNGTLIAFTRIGLSGGTGVDGTYLISPDGSGLKHVSPRPYFSWSPDGAHLVVGSGGLDIVDTSGRVVRELTRRHGDSHPAWSPDGRWIAFRNGEGVWLLPAQGGTPRLLVSARPSLWSQRISWSPNSAHLVYTAQHRRGTSWDDEMHVVNRDGTGERIVASSPAKERDPTWSPDGTRIAFSSASGRQRDVFVVDVDGANLRNVSSSPGYDGEPAWSPDGSMLAVASWRSGVEAIYVLAPSGGSAREVTRFPEARWPAWSSDGSHLAFTGGGECRRTGSLVIPVSGGKPDLVSNDCHLNGTEGNDRIQATWDRDIVHGLGGNDVINLDSGDDVAFGDAGDDTLRGGRMNDVLIGGAGRDRLVGGRGNDRLRTADGERDHLSCGPQRDWVFADRFDRISRDCERVRRRR
jgi:TolB protein